VADQIEETPQYHNGVEALLELLTAPSYLPVSRPAPLLLPQTSDQISCESTRPPPQNRRIPASTASTDNRRDRYHPRHKNQSKSEDKSPQPIEPRPKKKFTKLRQRIKKLYCYYPEEIYLLSVLPTQTPRELRHFQEHCFRIYQHQEGLNIVYEHGINRIRQITTSPLNFQGLLWKSKTTLSIGGITEYYCWICRHTRANNVARVNPEPAYQVDYDWTESLWTVGHLARHPST
jgi:hypothetical protein